MSRGGDTFFCKLCKEPLHPAKAEHGEDTTDQTWKNLCIHIWLHHPEYIKDNKIMEPVLDDVVPEDLIVP